MLESEEMKIKGHVEGLEVDGANIKIHCKETGEEYVKGIHAPHYRD
jgi:hypothetical protein